MYSVVTNWCKK